MREFNFKKIDAFASTNSEGNPAGYIKIKSKSDITESQMQKIAKELKGFVSEVGYAYKINEDTYNLKYFSAEREVEFCGHATIAIMYDLIKNDKILINKEFINIVTNKGKLIVENMIKSKDAVFIMSPVPEFRKVKISTEEIASSLKISTSEINNKYQISVVNAGLETLIVPIKKLHSILNIKPNLEELKQFCIKANIDIIEVFCDEVSGVENNFRTRVFAPTFGYLEDPATGSGNSAFGYYLLQNMIWDGDSLSIEQNAFINEYNVVLLKTRLDENKNTRVLFGGGGITKIIGKYLLHND